MTADILIVVFCSIYIIVESLWFTPKTNIILNINYTLVQKKDSQYWAHYSGHFSSLVLAPQFLTALVVL